jgi:3-hydroxy-9,10-secoandrosta-1,3,5(10)-triene-9,17-dione monooxygenase reductase component
MSRFASGLTAVTGISADGSPTGLLCQAFSSVSLSPPLILVCIAQTSMTWPKIKITGSFSVNILSRDQRDLCATLSSPGPRKLSAADWTPSPYGGVRLAGSLTDLDCVIEAVHASGDHDIVVGLVVDLIVNQSNEPLVYFDRRFHALGQSNAGEVRPGPGTGFAPRR